MKSVHMLSQQFNNHKVSFILLTTGFISMFVMLMTRIIVNRTGLILALIALIMLFLGILLLTSNLKNLSLSQKLLHWTPRIIVTLFGLFFSLLFAGVTMQSSRTPKLWEIGLGTFFCFLPAYFVLATLLFSRIWKWVGGMLFVLIGLITAFYYWNQQAKFDNYLLTTLPLIVIGILFLLNWWYLPKLIPEQKTIE